MQNNSGQNDLVKNNQVANGEQGWDESFLNAVKDVVRRTLAGESPTIVDCNLGDRELVAHPLWKCERVDPEILMLIKNNGRFWLYSRNNWLCSNIMEPFVIMDEWNDFIQYQYAFFGIQPSIKTGRQPILKFKEDELGPHFQLSEDEYVTNWCATVSEAKEEWNKIMIPLFNEVVKPGGNGQLPRFYSCCSTVYPERYSGVKEYISVRGYFNDLLVFFCCSSMEEAIKEWNALAEKQGR